MHLIFGNHDFVYKSPNNVKKFLSEYFEPREGTKLPLFPNITFSEGIILEYINNKNKKIYLTNDHQADFMNYVGWKFNRFLVRVL